MVVTDTGHQPDMLRFWLTRRVLPLASETGISRVWEPVAVCLV